MAKQVMAPIPGPFKAFVHWLRFRRGLDLTGRINFTRGFALGDVNFTAEDGPKLRALLDKPSAARAKPAAKSRDAPVDSGSDTF